MLFDEQKILINKIDWGLQGQSWGTQSSVYRTKTKKKVVTLKVLIFYLDLYKYIQKLLVPVPVEIDLKCPQSLLG